MRPPIPLHHAANLTQIEPSRLQFIAREFREFLEGDPTDSGDSFDEGAFSLLQQIHERLFQRGESPDSIRQALRGQMRKLQVVAVTSGKGGVGKTTVSVNLAVALAQYGRRVLLVDADLGMANVHVFAGIQPRATLLDLLDGNLSLAEVVSPGPGGIHVVCGPSGISRAADLDPRRIEMLGREFVRWGSSYDVLVLDTGAGISAQVLQFLAMAEEIVVVATPNLASTLDAYGMVKVIHERRLAGRIRVLVDQAESDAQAEAVLARIMRLRAAVPANRAVEPRVPAARSDLRGGESEPPSARPRLSRSRLRAPLSRDRASQLLGGDPSTEHLTPPCTAAA